MMSTQECSDKPADTFPVQLVSLTPIVSKPSSDVKVETNDNGYTEVQLEMATLPNDDQKSETENDVRLEKESPHKELTTESLCFLYRLNRLIRRFFSRNWTLLKRIFLVLLLAAYLAYFSYCMYYEFGDEASVRLLVCTVLGLCILAQYLVRRLLKCPCGTVESRWFSDPKQKKKIRKIIRWMLYILSVGGTLGILVDITLKRPENLISLSGMAILLLVCFFVSLQPEKVNWHAVFWGIGLQFWFAVLIRKTAFGSSAFQWLADRVVEFLKYTDKGSRAVFGPTFTEHRFVFQLMPTLLFFNAVISMLYYLGLVQIFIAKFGKFLSFCLGTSPIESVSAAANLFLTLSETPILIKPFLNDVTQSELFAVLTGGFASIAGSLLWAFAAYGAPVDHILTASVMSAPAALAFAKLLYPDERKPTVKAEDAYRVDVTHYGSLLGALSKGASEGLKMAGHVVINLIVYVALLEFLDQTLVWFSARAGVEGLTFSKLIAYVFYPAAFLMGFELRDCFQAARLLGVKILTTTTLSFIELGTVITNGKTLREYESTYGTNGTWSYIGNDVHLHMINSTLRNGVFLSERSGILATYMICGLSNLGAVGIAIGAYTSLAPKRLMDVIRRVPFALLAGNFASFSTACVAGLLFTDS